jgi:hypothetical protein
MGKMLGQSQAQRSDSYHTNKLKPDRIERNALPLGF